MAGAAVRVSWCTLPVLGRFFSTRATSEPEGLRRAAVLPELTERLQPASAPAPAMPSPASRKERRLMLFTG
jgi:hypothetical protein